MQQDRVRSAVDVLVVKVASMGGEVLLQRRCKVREAEAKSNRGGTVELFAAASCVRASTVGGKLKW